MSDSFAACLRQTVAALLPKGALLRRDRGGALYVTDAPRRRPGVDWPAIFMAAGFACDLGGGLARLTPGGRWMDALAARFPGPPDPLCAALARFDGPPEPAVLALFTRGLKALDTGTPDPGYDRALRQEAAICLRDKARTGGGLYACALVRHLMKGEQAT